LAQVFRLHPLFPPSAALAVSGESTMPMDLATPEAFFKDPRLVWRFYNYRGHMALKAAPNNAYLALAKPSGEET